MEFPLICVRLAAGASVSEERLAGCLLGHKADFLRLAWAAPAAPEEASADCHVLAPPADRVSAALDEWRARLARLPGGFPSGARVRLFGGSAADFRKLAAWGAILIPAAEPA